jgi:hypothetical protein
MNRERYPKGMNTRKALFIVLQNKGFQSNYIHLLLGHSLSALDPSDRHLFTEHPEHVSSDLDKLRCDEAYRKQKVDEYLAKYKPEIEEATVWVKTRREEMRKSRVARHS